MYADFIYPEYEVVRNYQRCIACRACERQCANEVHRYDADEQMMTADDAKCVNCHRCVSLCPTRALKIVRTDHTFKENANWTKDNIQNVYRQAATGGVLLSSMGNPEPLPGYWDRILINASQVTNPPGRLRSWVCATTPARAACMRIFTVTAPTPSCRWRPAGSAYTANT